MIMIKTVLSSYKRVRLTSNIENSVALLIEIKSVQGSNYQSLHYNLWNGGVGAVIFLDRLLRLATLRNS